MNYASLENQALEIRRDIVGMIAKAKSGHPGGSLSCTDILVSLYFGGILNCDPKNPKKEDRDYFILGKGHAAPALYATLARKGYFSPEDLPTLRQVGSKLQGHPDSNLLDGIEVSTGSLGQGLSIACGIACGNRLKAKDVKTFVLLGDGECQEGQIWEAATFGAHQKLGNLVAIVDSNGLQIDGACADVCESAEIGDKFAAFGWNVTQADGHDFSSLLQVLKAAHSAGGEKPHVIIANTVKGKGVSFMENNAGWHGNAPNSEQLDIAIRDLESISGADRSVN